LITALAFLLAALQDPQDAPVEPVPAETFAPHVCSAWDVGLGAGLWWLGPFEATTPFGLREITGDLLVEADLELSWSSHEWTFAALLAVASTDDSDVLLAGLEIRTPPLLDLTWIPDVPLSLTAAAGILAGSYDVDVEGFGDFEPGVGGQARLSIETSRLDSLRVAVWVGLRFLEFDYDEPTLSGDESIGGAGLAAGISGVLRF
jgi:hypothetical protein